MCFVVSPPSSSPMVPYQTRTRTLGSTLAFECPSSRAPRSTA
jgi:hypothetical protein